MFEAVQFVERRRAFEPEETVLAEHESELDAVEAARDARTAFLESGSEDYAWWVVRQQGARLSNFISDSKSDREFVLDLTSGELVEIPS